MRRVTSTEAGTEPPPPPPAPPVERGQKWRFGSVEALAVLLIGVVIFRGPISGALSHAALATWTTVFVAVVTQAMPFLVFGVVLSAVIAVFVPASFFAKVLPSNPALAVPVVLEIILAVVVKIDHFRIHIYLCDFSRGQTVCHTRIRRFQGKSLVPISAFGQCPRIPSCC